MTDSASRYTGTAIALHWLIAALIVFGFCVGLWMTQLEMSPQKFRWYAYHKWIGITVFLLAVYRLAWRLRHSPPPDVAMPAWQQRAAHAAHWLLYVLILVIPISGWIYSSSTGVSVIYLGLVQLPDLVGKDKALAVFLRLIHIGLNYTMAGLVIVHTGAALRHQFVDRDGLLARMVPFLDRS